jgi:hypothetical protein
MHPSLSQLVRYALEERFRSALAALLLVRCKLIRVEEVRDAFDLAPVERRPQGPLLLLTPPPLRGRGQAPSILAALVAWPPSCPSF